MDALTATAILTARQIAAAQIIKTNSGKGHVTVSAAQLAYLSGNRDPRVIKLARGGNPTVEEALASIGYYIGRANPSKAGIVANALSTGQVIPVSAFGYPVVTFSANAGPLRQTRTVSYPRGAAGAVTTLGPWVDAAGVQAVANTAYKLPDGSCDTYYPARAPASTFDRGTPERVEHGACPANSEVNKLVDFTIPGLSAPVVDIRAALAQRLQARLNAARSTVGTWPTLTRTIGALRALREARWNSPAWA